MKIPLEIKPYDFYLALQKKGLVPSSRYPNVIFHCPPGQKKSPKWRAQLRLKGKVVHIGTFEFTHIGEKQAADAAATALATYVALNGPIPPKGRPKKNTP